MGFTASQVSFRLTGFSWMFLELQIVGLVEDVIGYDELIIIDTRYHS